MKITKENVRVGMRLEPKDASEYDSIEVLRIHDFGVESFYVERTGWDSLLLISYELLTENYTLSQPTEEKKWKDGEKVFYVNIYGGVDNYLYGWSESFDLIKSGNAFHTEQEARESEFYKVFHG